MAKTVLCHGCFDPLHPGHVLHFEAARKLGSRLVVAVTRDKYVGKGAGRPVFPQKLRAHMVKALRCVDKVILARDSIDALRRAKADVFVKGAEYRGAILPADAAYCRRNGIRIAFTDTKRFSSTALLHHYA